MKITAQAGVIFTLSDAQRANEWDMGGHAARAKDLLSQASREIKLAADAGNHH